MLSLIAKVAFYGVCNAPLNRISSPKANFIEKTISAIAIAVFTILSAGYYAFYAHRYFAERRLESRRIDLYNAVESGDVQRIQSLFEKVPTLKERPEEGHEPVLMHLAIENGRLDVANLLFNNNVDIDGVGRTGTPLAVATRYQDLESMKWLLEHKANPNIDKFSDNPLDIAIIRKCKDKNVKFDMIDLLLDHGADPKKDSSIPLLESVSMMLWKENPQRTQDILKKMIDKGAILEDDSPFQIPVEARIFIENYSKQPSAQ